MIVRRDGEADPLYPHCVVAIGVFDGLHRGHQRVIKMVTDLASQHGSMAVVATFDPHPAEVLDPEGAPLLLGTLDQRLEGMAGLGIELVRVLTFDHALAAQSAEEFVQRVLVDELNCEAVIVGDDFRFGHDRLGDVALLERLGPAGGFSVIGAPLFGDAQRWSSTAVRALLAAGDVGAAARILGRAYVLRASVGHGDARGAQLGFPTANLVTSPRHQLPARGIYAGAARTSDGVWWPAAISVGTRPQFYDGASTLVEVHLVGYSGDLYGSSLDVAFLERQRDEAVFSDVAALVTQIEADVAATTLRFSNFSSDESALLRWTFGQRR
jgi:riboflavin kinase/FMN adenylyltransferase